MTLAVILIGAVLIIQGARLMSALSDLQASVSALTTAVQVAVNAPTAPSDDAALADLKTQVDAATASLNARFAVPPPPPAQT